MSGDDNIQKYFNSIVIKFAGTSALCKAFFLLSEVLAPLKDSS